MLSNSILTLVGASQGVNSSIIAKYRSKANRNRIPVDTISKIIKFWTDNSAVTTDRVFHYKIVEDEVTKKPFRTKSKIFKRILQARSRNSTRCLTCSVLNAVCHTQDTMHTVYNHYLEAHPQNMCSFFVFYRAKPAYIRSHQVCTV
jgi:hypothetical protein